MHAEARAFLTVDQVAGRLCVAPSTVRYWVSRGDLPAYRFGKHLRFDRVELSEWISAQRGAAS